MKAFRAQYHGRFIFEVTIVKGYNDDEKFLNQKNEWKCNAKEAFP